MSKTEHPEVAKLAANIAKFADTGAARKIARGRPLPPAASDEEKAEWVGHIAKRLDEEFDEETIRNIRMGCHCDEAGRLGEMKRWLGQLYRESASLREFVDKVNGYGAGWTLEGDVIHTRFLTCECYMVQAAGRLETKTWCYCTVGYTRNLFEHVFGCAVETELLQAIKMGHECCVVTVRRKEPQKPQEGDGS